MLKKYMVRKVVWARNLGEAFKKEGEYPAEDIVIAEEYLPEKPSEVVTGFTTKKHGR